MVGFQVERIGMEDKSETVLIAVDTNFDTNLLVIPPRSATIADVRERIRHGHMSLYPSHGDISIQAVKVELFNRHYLLDEGQEVGQIFRGLQGCLFVELEGNSPVVLSPPNTRLKRTSEKSWSVGRAQKHSLVGERVVNSSDDPANKASLILARPERSLSVREGHRSPFKHGTSSPLGKSESEKDVSSKALDDAYNSSKTSFSSGSREDVPPALIRTDGQEVETMQDGLDSAVDALLQEEAGRSDVDRRLDLNADEGSKLNEKNSFAPRSDQTPRPVPATNSEVTKESVERKRKSTGLLAVVGLPNPETVSTSYQSTGKLMRGSIARKGDSKGKLSASQSRVDRGLVKGVLETIEKVLIPTQIAKESSKGPSNHEPYQNVGFPRNVETTQNSARTFNGFTTANGPQVSQGEEARLVNSGDNHRRADVQDINKKLGCTGNHPNVAKENSNSEKCTEPTPVSGKLALRRTDVEKMETSSSGGSSLSYKPEGSAATKDVDDVVSKLVSWYSPMVSDESEGKESSDASEECQFKGPRASLDADGLGAATNTAAAKTKRRASVSEAEMKKYQHFIDSQDGLDQLLGLTLSHRKSKESTESELDAQVQGNLVALDGLPIDRVPDTQLGLTSLNHPAPGHLSTEEHAHKKVLSEGSPEKAVGPDDQEGCNDRICKSGEKIGRCSTPTDTSISLKNFATLASESAKKDSSDGHLQPRSDDSQRFQAAVQLARLGMGNDECDGVSESRKSSKDESFDKKKKRKGKQSVEEGATKISELPDDAVKLTKVDHVETGSREGNTSVSDAGQDEDVHEVWMEPKPLSLESRMNSLGSTKENGTNILATNENVPPEKEAVTRECGRGEVSPTKVGKGSVSASQEKRKFRSIMGNGETQRNVKGERNSEEKVDGFVVSEGGKEARAVVTGDDTACTYVADSPDQEKTGNIERNDDLQGIESSVLTKSGRKRKTKKKADDGREENELRPGDRVLRQSDELLNGSNGKKSSNVSSAPEALNELPVCLELDAKHSTAKKQKKKESVDLDEAFARVSEMRYMAFMNGSKTSGNSGEVVQLKETDPVDTERSKPPSSKKKKVKRPGLIEQLDNLTERDAGKGQVEPPDVALAEHGTVAEHPEEGTLKGKKMRKKSSVVDGYTCTLTEKSPFRTPDHTEEFQRQLRNGASRKSDGAEKGKHGVEQGEEDKEYVVGLSSSLEDPTVKDGTKDDVPLSEKKTKKRKSSRIIEEGAPDVTVALNESAVKEKVLEATFGDGYVGYVDQGGKKEASRKRKKSRVEGSSLVEDESDDVLEPSCNQLGYRMTPASGRKKSVSGPVEGEDTDFGTGGSTSSKKKTPKASDGKSSAPLEYADFRKPKEKRRKKEIDQGMNGARA